MYSFSIRLHEDTDTSDAAIIFGTVKVNVGNGYDEFTGLNLPSSLPINQMTANENLKCLK